MRFPSALVMLLGVLGCGEPSAGDMAARGMQSMAAPPPSRRVVLGPIVPGEMAHIYVLGGLPGATVQAALGEGHKRRGCALRLQDMCTDLTGPFVFGEGVVGSDGAAVIDLLVPAGVPRGKKLYAQAALRLGDRRSMSGLMSGAARTEAPAGAHPCWPDTDFDDDGTCDAGDPCPTDALDACDDGRDSGGDDTDPSGDSGGTPPDDTDIPDPVDTDLSGDTGAVPIGETGSLLPPPPPEDSGWMPPPPPPDDTGSSWPPNDTDTVPPPLGETGGPPELPGDSGIWLPPADTGGSPPEGDTDIVVLDSGDSTPDTADTDTDAGAGDTPPNGTTEDSGPFVETSFEYTSETDPASWGPVDTAWPTSP